MDKNEFSYACYQKYQLYWMLTHGYSLMDFIEQIRQVLDDQDKKLDLEDIFNIWEADYGFNGALYVCYEEFLGSEYLDKDFMRLLLSQSEYDTYEKDAALKRVCTNQIYSLTAEHLEEFTTKFSEEELILNMVEEHSELIKELSKSRKAELRGDKIPLERRDHICEEIAHVWMTLESIQHLYGIMPSEINREITRKLDEYVKDNAGTNETNGHI